MKDKIRPLYSELQGYLSQAPDDHNRSLHHESQWEQLHLTIDELNQITGKSYDKFILKPFTTPGGSFVDVTEYRTKLGGLISRLHGEYFSDEPAPFSGMPSTIINQNQHQSQNIQILLEIQSLIDKKLSDTDDAVEISFLQKIKDSLSTVKSINDLLGLILSTGSSVGLTLEQITRLFK